jgi:hypothetical protein
MLRAAWQESHVALPANSVAAVFAHFRELDFLFQYSLILRRLLCGLFEKIGVCGCIVVQNYRNIGICCAAYS